MEPEKKKLKVTQSTDWPYPAPQWPNLASSDQEAILELLCDFLRPVGQHRRDYIARSKGKRNKRVDQKAKRGGDGKTSVVPPMPESVHSVTVGFNSTIKLLQRQACLASGATPLSSAEGNLNLRNTVAAVFVCASTLPALLTSSIAMLVAAASAQYPSALPVRLIALPIEAERRLAEVLFQPRVGFVSLLHDAPGGKALIDMALDKAPPVEIAWLKARSAVEYMPVKIKATATFSDSI